MKKTILTFGIAVAFIGSSMIFTSCDNAKKTTEDADAVEQTDETSETTEEEVTEEAVHAHYQCPMKCEGDKVYEEAGKCPVCKMELAMLDETTETEEVVEEVVEEESHEGHSH